MTSLMHLIHLKMQYYDFKCLKYAYIVHKTLLKAFQEHYQMVFSRFLATTTFVPAENTRHSEFPGHIPASTHYWWDDCHFFRRRYHIFRHTRRDFLPQKQLCHVHCLLYEGALYVRNLSGRSWKICENKKLSTILTLSVRVPSTAGYKLTSL
jgi:hypothetical protein